MVKGYLTRLAYCDPAVYDKVKAALSAERAALDEEKKSAPRTKKASRHNPHKIRVILAPPKIEGAGDLLRAANAGSNT